jgi:hypothetical protein
VESWRAVGETPGGGKLHLVTGVDGPEPNLQGIGSYVNAYSLFAYMRSFKVIHNREFLRFN